VSDIHGRDRSNGVVKEIVGCTCHLRSRGLGVLYSQIGWRAEACTGLSAAINLYRAMDMTLWLPQAEAALAQVEGL
jgi:hypothetical protein